MPMNHSNEDETRGMPPRPRYPEGTPEYEAYTAALKVELDKFAAGEDPYPYEATSPRVNCPVCGSGEHLCPFPCEEHHPTSATGGIVPEYITDRIAGHKEDQP